MGTSGYFPAVQQPENETNSQSTADVKNECSHISSHSQAIMACARTTSPSLLLLCDNKHCSGKPETLPILIYFLSHMGQIKMTMIRRVWEQYLRKLALNYRVE